MKTNIITILDPNYKECHDFITNSLKNDLKTLYSCILVNRSFCRIFIPILWRNPFKFVKRENKLSQIFNTLIHCLQPSDKIFLEHEELIKMEKLPTPKTYFEYYALIKEFELNPLQRGLTLWTLTHTKFDIKSFGKKLTRLNNYIGDLFFSKGNQYNSLNIYYGELLNEQNEQNEQKLFDIFKFNNHEESLVNVNKLSLGFLHKNSKNLIPRITENFLKLENFLSPNIQHLQISIDTFEEHPALTKNMINFIQSQRSLKSLILNSIYWKNDKIFQPFLFKALQTQSKCLTYLALQDFIISIGLLLPILRSLPNLITLELDLRIKIVALQEIPPFLFNNLENVCYDCNLLNPSILDQQSNLSRLLFKQILISSNNKLKSLKINDSYCKEVQQRYIPNLTHLHLITNRRSMRNLLILLKELPQLVHLRLDPISDREYLLNYTYFEFKKFSEVLASSLKILELNFENVDGYLEILFNETNLNLQCIKFYHYKHYKDTSLRIFLDYAKRKKCFRELGIPHNHIMRFFSEEHIKEARDHFDITVNADNEINNPFYDVPINNS